MNQYIKLLNIIVVAGAVVDIGQQLYHHVHVFVADSNAIRFAMIEQKLDSCLVFPHRGVRQRRDIMKLQRPKRLASAINSIERSAQLRSSFTYISSKIIRKIIIIKMIVAISIRRINTELTMKIMIIIRKRISTTIMIMMII
jgi:hypothetical protein